MKRRAIRTRSPEFRILAVVIVLAATAAVTAGIVSSSRNGKAFAEAAPLSSFVPIQDVAPNVKAPPRRRGASTGVFTVDCGTNGNGKFSPDNPVAQPGIRNGAQHVHDFVGNLSITADSSDESLAASDTTCRNGDKSSYFWPVVRIDRTANRQANPLGANADTLKAAGTPTIACPTVTDKLPAIPAQSSCISRGSRGPGWSHRGLSLDRGLAAARLQVALPLEWPGYRTGGPDIYATGPPNSPRPPAPDPPDHRPALIQ